MSKRAEVVHPVIVKLIEERRRIGWTQLDIADEIDKSVGAVQSFEKQANAGILNIERYAEAMGLEMVVTFTAHSEGADVARDKMYKRNGEKKNRGWIRNSMDDQIELQRKLVWLLEQDVALRAREVAIREQELAQRTPQHLRTVPAGEGRFA